MTQPSTDAVQTKECNHDNSEYWCDACGKPAFYENLCYDCGDVNTRHCFDCDEVFEVR